MEYGKIQETNPMQSEPAKPTYADYTMGLLTTQQAQDLTKRIMKQRKEVEKWINGAIPQLILGVLLLLSLFMSDAWILGNAPDSSNIILNVTLMIVFVAFCAEGIILSFVQDGYVGSFFFWMDTIGTLSILLDITWVSNSFIPDGTIATQGSVLRATKAAKLGARYGRLMRLLKMLRFLKDIPCLQFLNNTDEYEPTMTAIKKVSEELSSLLSMRVAALVMILVIIMPFLSYDVTDFSENAWLNNMRITAKNASVTEFDIAHIAAKCVKFYGQKDASVLAIYIESPWVNNTFSEEYPSGAYVRTENTLKYESTFKIPVYELLSSGQQSAVDSVPAGATGDVAFAVNLKINNTVEAQYDALYSMIIIILVIVILFMFTGSFNSAVNRLVVKPLEKMMTTLRNSAKLMIKSLSAVEKQQEKDDDTKPETDGEERDDEDMETEMLEKMVEKLAKIVAHVLPQANEISVDANVDASTANWLNEAYSSGASRIRRNSTALKSVLESNSTEDEADRLDTLENALTMVSKETLNSWDFDVLEYSNAELCDIITYQFSLLNLLNEFRVPKETFQRFMSEICSRYVETNTYHNFKHGCDVCHTTYRLLMITSLNTMLSRLEVFALLVSSLAHDVGHPGVNNVYLVKAKHDLALAHNDRSPLENMHCVMLYEVLRKGPTNIFVNLSAMQWTESRKVILTVILGTDMSHHFEQISKTQLFGDLHGDETKAYYKGNAQSIECLNEEKNRLFIMELVLHCSDISNPYKPFAVCAKWADLVVEEFCQQGDREQREGLEISPMCDRKAVNLCNMQLGFIEFVVAPLINAFIAVFPPLTEIGDNMTANVVGWCERRKVEVCAGSAGPEEQATELAKLDERIAKFRDKMSFMDELKLIKKRKSLT